MSSQLILLDLPLAAAVLADSPYERDEAHASSLLSRTLEEQAGRFHTLALLANYLAQQPTSSRNHQLLSKEYKALQDLYEAVWYELGCAFPADTIDQACQPPDDKARQLRLRRSSEI